MSHNTDLMRIKLLTLPQRERFVVVIPQNASVSDLKELVYQTLVNYAIYRVLLLTCDIWLELQSNNSNFAISGSYLIKELIRPNDVFIVKLVNKHQSPLQQLQPPAIPIEATFLNQQSMNGKINKFEAYNVNLNNTAIQDQKENENEEKTMSYSLDDEEKEQIKHQTIFALIDKYGDGQFVVDDDDHNDKQLDKEFDDHSSVLLKLREFSLRWFEEKGDKEHLFLNQLSKQLKSVFPKQMEYLKSRCYMNDSDKTSSFELQLFVQLGIQQQIDPHITLNIDLNFYKFEWMNYMVLDRANTSKLFTSIKNNFVHDINQWNEFGFGFLSDDYFKDTKQDWESLNILTTNGGNLIDNPGWDKIIKDLRIARLMLFSFNSKKGAMQLFKTEKFQNSITKHKEYGFGINTDKWLRFCMDDKILPACLLKTWVTESSDAFMQKREFNRFIKELCEVPCKNRQKWIDQKNGYYQEAQNATYENLDHEYYGNKYPIYFESCSVYSKYLEKFQGKLNGYLCDDMIEIYLNDCIQGAQIFETSSENGVAQLFENHLVDKMRMIISCINNTNKFDKINRLRLCDQDQQINFWSHFREKYGYGKHRKSERRGTPDILLNKPIFINNRKVHWLDAKHYFVTSDSKILFKKFSQSVKKYTDSFGTGAIVCNGFESGIDQTAAIKDCNLLLLDGSRDFAAYQKS